jgi:hypothetical protein
MSAAAPNASTEYVAITPAIIAQLWGAQLRTVSITVTPVVVFSIRREVGRFGSDRLYQRVRETTAVGYIFTQS